MATFGLVHGAWHGSWQWERLRPELEGLGHSVRAVDLPCEDPGAACSAYAAIVVEALSGSDDDLILVGHSLGGLTVPIAASELQVRHLVFLCSVLPVPGISLVDQLQAEPSMARRDEYAAGLSDPDDLGRNRWIDFEIAWRSFYGDCDENAARAAFDRLRPQATAPYVEPCPLERLPEVERTYVVCSDDGIVNAEWATGAARARLGVEPVNLPGSHSPFLSRPSELARLLAGLV